MKAKQLALSLSLSLSHQDDYKTRKDTKKYMPKQRQTQSPHTQWRYIKQQINKSRTTALERSTSNLVMISFIIIHNLIKCFYCATYIHLKGANHTQECTI